MHYRKEVEYIRNFTNSFRSIKHNKHLQLVVGVKNKENRIFIEIYNFTPTFHAIAGWISSVSLVI